jgi:hypothetical protein
MDDDTHLVFASPDTFVRYRLLVEDRYPDVFVPETAALKTSTTPRRRKRADKGRRPPR